MFELKKQSVPIVIGLLFIAVIAVIWVTNQPKSKEVIESNLVSVEKLTEESNQDDNSTRVFIKDHEAMNEWENLLYDRDNMVEYIMPKKYMFPTLANVIVDSIFARCEEYNLDPLFMLIFMISESNVDYRAVSNGIGAKGLMQIYPKYWTAKLIEEQIFASDKDYFMPAKNIHGGIYIFRSYLDEETNKKQSNLEALKRTVHRYKGGDDPKYIERIYKIYGDYILFSMTKETSGMFSKPEPVQEVSQTPSLTADQITDNRQALVNVTLSNSGE